jgi:hypothetical protein
MIYKSSLILSVFMLSNVLISQELMPLFEDTVMSKNELTITSFNYYSSNTFNNQLLDKFIFGGNISEELKNTNQEKLSRLNAIGGEIEQSINFYSKDLSLFNKDKYGLLFSISDNHFASGNLSNDLFSLAMNGNSEFIGDTLRFDFSHFEYQHYQKIGFGIFDKRTRSSISVSYVSGSRQIGAQLNESYLVSELDTVTLALQGLGSRSSGFSPYFGLQGNGFSVDLNYNLLFNSKKGNPQVINVSIHNIGLIFWNRSSYKYAVDSISQYSGFDVNDFINSDGEAPNYNFEDTLGINSVQGAYLTNLPIEFVLQKTPDLRSAQKIQFIAGFKTILTAEYFPYFFAGGFYRPTENIGISSRLSYGGFAGLRWGLNFNYWNENKFGLSIGTFDMIGLVSKDYGFGRGANLMLNVKL